MSTTLLERFFRGLLAMAAGVALAPTAVATPYYWDTNGASSGSGSGGGATADWLTDSWAATGSGLVPTGAWPNTQPNNDDEAILQGTAGTIDLSADVYANAVSILTRNYAITSSDGALHLSGSEPAINVSPPSLANNGQQTVRISAPITGSNGFRLMGNGLAGGFKFLQLENNSVATPNSFSGALAIAPGGSLRIGGEVNREQIPDNVDMDVQGVVDFVTSGGASDMKQERVRDVSVSGGSAIFSVGNGTDFVLNSLTGVETQGISINGNNASVPGTLRINGWASGGGDLTLHSAAVKLNTTGATAAIGGRIVLSGDIETSGDSQIINNNGRASSAATNNFANKALDFASDAHTINVASGALVITSASASHPLEITTTQPGGAVVTKTGPGTLLFENAVQTSFTGAMKVQQGVLSLSGPALADAVDLHLESGAAADLNFVGGDTINALYIAGIPQSVGSYGAIGNSSADFQTNFLTGPGLLNVSTLGAPLGLLGDFNQDNIVDAIDYAVWREQLGAPGGSLPNADGVDGVIGHDHYTLWSNNYGNRLAPGTAASAAPEPASLGLLGIGCLAATRRRRSLCIAIPFQLGSYGTQCSGRRF